MSASQLQVHIVNLRIIVAVRLMLLVIKVNIVTYSLVYILFEVIT